MEWLRIGEVIINVNNVKHLERRGRFVIFHYLGDSDPLMVPFKTPEEAARWLEGFFISTKNKQPSLDTTNWKLN